MPAPERVLEERRRGGAVGGDEARHAQGVRDGGGERGVPLAGGERDQVLPVGVERVEEEHGERQLLA